MHSVAHSLTVRWGHSAFQLGRLTASTICSSK